MIGSNDEKGSYYFIIYFLTCIPRHLYALYVRSLPFDSSFSFTLFLILMDPLPHSHLTFSFFNSMCLQATEDRNLDVLSLSLKGGIITVEHPAERALVFELMQMGDVISSVLTDLLPNRLCDYLKEISVKFTDFVTKCHVLNVEESLMNSRLLICLATKLMMKKCFDLLGIDTLERI